MAIQGYRSAPQFARKGHRIVSLADIQCGPPSFSAATMTVEQIERFVAFGCVISFVH